MNNTTLAGLHAERQRRQERAAQHQERAAEERRQQNAAAKEELKVASKVGRQKLKGAVAAKASEDEEDLDALLEELSVKETCALSALAASRPTR